MKAALAPVLLLLGLTDPTRPSPQLCKETMDADVGPTVCGFIVMMEFAHPWNAGMPQEQRDEILAKCADPAKKKRQAARMKFMEFNRAAVSGYRPNFDAKAANDADWADLFFNICPVPELLNAPK